MRSTVPERRGTYVLVLRLARPAALEVGRLGCVEFPAGYYAYVGSALGPGGLAARLKHHLREAARPRWHIDYLRRAARPVEVWVSRDGRRREHAWVRALAARPEIGRPVAGFGASDCRCGTHLFHANRLATMTSVRPELEAAVHVCR